MPRAAAAARIDGLGEPPPPPRGRAAAGAQRRPPCSLQEESFLGLAVAAERRASPSCPPSCCAPEISKPHHPASGSSPPAGEGPPAESVGREGLETDEQGWAGFRNFFIFILLFFDLSKIYIIIFILQICHPAARSSGGRKVPPDEPAVSFLAHGPSNIPPFDPAVATYRRMNWR